MNHDLAPTRLPVCMRRFAVLSATLAAIALAAGCGSDDSDNSDSTSQSTAQAPAADGPVNEATIRERIAGNTVTGTMSPDSAYTEYYAPNGTIHGASYQARWTIEDDRMCFDYDEAPEADCYAVLIDGNSVQWQRNGEVQGEGSIVEGNPNNF